MHKSVTRFYLFAPALLAFALVIAMASCNKEPGRGGNSSITGKVFVQNYSNSCSNLDAEFYGVDEDVFIIYGDDPSYSDNVKTGPGGVFWFPNLRKGTYTIYALSESCIPSQGDTIISQKVEITGRNETIEIPDLVVIR
jgi:hypothetical protein